MIYRIEQARVARNSNGKLSIFIDTAEYPGSGLEFTISNEGATNLATALATVLSKQAETVVAGTGILPSSATLGELQAEMTRLLKETREHIQSRVSFEGQTGPTAYRRKVNHERAMSSLLHLENGSPNTSKRAFEYWENLVDFLTASAEDYGPAVVETYRQGLALNSTNIANLAHRFPRQD